MLANLCLLRPSKLQFDAKPQLAHLPIAVIQLAIFIIPIELMRWTCTRHSKQLVHNCSASHRPLYARRVRRGWHGYIQEVKTLTRAPKHRVHRVHT